MAGVRSPPALVRVLVVEDNPVIRDLLNHGVRRLAQELETCPAIEVIEVEDGATAWDRIKDGTIDLVVVDLYLPVLGGIELITRIRDTPEIAHTKILAMSASFSDAKDRSLGAGADTFMQKPLRLVDLLDNLRTLLRTVLEPGER
jgi:CheY-like chemotaxis protein